MPRLAWFTPLPPVRSGIARYNAELLPLLRPSFEIDLFIDGWSDAVCPPDGFLAFNAFDFVWKHRQQPYDLTVFQLGNAPCHDYMWAYLVRYPGLVVLHDGQLHHARGRTLLQQRFPRHDDYRREFQFCHPDVHPDLAELGVEGLLGSLTYLWPMRRIAVEASRKVVVHNRWLAAEICDEQRNAVVDVIDMGVPEARPSPGARDVVRTRFAIPPDAVLFTAFGKVTPEKRIRQAVRALPTVGEAVPNAHMLIAGEIGEGDDVLEDAAIAGVGDRVTVAGYVDDDEIDDYLAASDVCLCMRWPTSRETSASWLRCLASARPTISTDLSHAVDTPTLDPRNWSLLHAGADDRPVGVGIDILDEDHSLRLAMRRLAVDEVLRRTLSANALELWRSRFTVERMASNYVRTIAEALERPAAQRSASGLPLHLLQTGTEHLEGLMADLDLPSNPLGTHESDV